MPNGPIVHSVIVDAAVPNAFDAFTADLGKWWPLAYTFSQERFADAAIEPRPGGVWFERDEGGERLCWGDVREYVPGERLVVGFAIGPDRQPVGNDAASEVEVRFTDAGAGRTRIEVEHRGFERHGESAEAMRA